MKKLPLDGRIDLLNQLTADFLSMTKDASAKVPVKKTYKVASRAEPMSVRRAARMAAFQRINSDGGFVKVGFDTRRINQEVDRIPRTNLQHWNRSQQYLEEEDAKRLETLAQLVNPLKEIQDTFLTHPEYFNSYSRILYDTVKRALRVQEGDLEIYRPQLDYLEQLLFTRYRLSLEDISKMGEATLKDRILRKDEDLLKRGAYLEKTSPMRNEPKAASNTISLKDGDSHNDLIKTLFSTNRKSGEKTIERTVTITIRDSVID